MAFGREGAHDRTGQGRARQSTWRVIHESSWQFIRAHEQAQRGVAFLLFGQPDCDLVVPNLYAKGGAIRRKARTKPDAPAPSKELEALPVSKEGGDERVLPAEQPA